MTVDGGVTMVQLSTPPLSPDPSSVVCRKFGVLWFVLRIQFQSEYVFQKPLSAPLRWSDYFDFSNCRYLPSGGGGGDLFAHVAFELSSRFYGGCDGCCKNGRYSSVGGDSSGGSRKVGCVLLFYCSILHSLRWSCFSSKEHGLSSGWLIQAAVES